MKKLLYISAYIFNPLFFEHLFILYKSSILSKVFTLNSIWL